MRCLRCGVCCQETDMLLSEEDILRLERVGYKHDSFVRFNIEAYAMLRNRQGYCVFYNQKDKQCSVYAFRPSGCRVYPVILDEETGIIVDPICRAQGRVSEKEKARKGKKVVAILKMIDEEASERRSK